MVRRLLVPLLAALVAAGARAQNTDQDLPHSDSLRQGAALHDVIRKGTLEGRFRLFLMGTINDGAPLDHHAQAFGGSLGFASQRWKGLQFRMSGGYAFDLWSSDLTAPDPLTNQPNRYEIGLFDVTAPRKDDQLAYLQLFQLNYRSRNERTLLVLGRQEINTPFINPQDGRMQPTLAEGFWGSYRTARGLKLQSGLLYGFAPRSTAGWYSAEKSIGIYPVGLGVDGKPSRYAGNITCPGVAMAGAQWTGPRKLTFSAWEVVMANVSNTAMVQAERGGRDDRWMVGAMAIRQDKLGNGGNPADSLAYFQSDASMALSGRFRMNMGRFRWQFNYTRITADGRYLMPREWGRDPFYTFLPRERNEGLGDVHAATVNLIWRAKSGWRIQGDVGRYWLPATTDAALNKYAFPSYLQLGLNAHYQFNGDWKGLAVQFLNVAKLAAPGAVYSTKQAVNKVDMFHTEVVINYAF